MSRLDNPERHAIAFRSLTPADLPLMHRWRNNPAITTWWEAVPGYAEIVAKYTPRISGEDPIHPFIALCDGVPIGYLQWCRLAEGPGHAADGIADAGAAAVDLFIGEDAYRGRGVGAAMLRAFLREIIFAPPDVTTCFIDPDPGNAVAIRSYERVGFRPLGVVREGADGDPAWLMRIDRDAALSR
jgi:RimJ/RimL family protein N-acetyltransferase